MSRRLNLQFPKHSTCRQLLGLCHTQQKINSVREPYLCWQFSVLGKADGVGYTLPDLSRNGGDWHTPPTLEPKAGPVW